MVEVAQGHMGSCGGGMEVVQGWQVGCWVLEVCYWGAGTRMGLGHAMLEGCMGFTDEVGGWANW